MAIYAIINAMKIYFAPMEGITGNIVRNAYYHNFPGIDRYFTPFIPTGKGMNSKVKRDIAPENNVGIDLIPQAISTDLDDLMRLEDRLMARGYTEYNLNFGCPSGTVVSKGRGAGFLADPLNIDRFLERLFDATSMKISVKTRVGVTDDSQWSEILDVYSRYPLTELIVHPRIQKDFYKGLPRLECYKAAYEELAADVLVYNGDITDYASYRHIVDAFPGTSAVMIGRGLLMYPGLAGSIASGQELDTSDPAYLRQLRVFHDEIYAGYSSIFSGPKDTIMHMKEIWTYLRMNFPESEKEIKKLLKSKNEYDYLTSVKKILNF